MNVQDYSKISPTAKMTAYWRAKSDIPHSREVAHVMQGEDMTQQLIGQQMTSVMAQYSPMVFEARYKAINRGLQMCKSGNVMELASGLSPRGLGVVDAGHTYVGADLPNMIESAPLMTSIAVHDGIDPRNLFYEAVNVLDRQQMGEASQHFKGQSFDICNEGLLMYLNLEEKTRLCANIHQLLTPVMGAWITTDIEFHLLRAKLLNSVNVEFREMYKNAIADISSRVGRDMMNNEFFNIEDAAAFFSQAGFAFRRFPYYDGSYTLSTLLETPEYVREPLLDVLSSIHVWILTPTL